MGIAQQGHELGPPKATLRFRRPVTANVKSIGSHIWILRKFLHAAKKKIN